MHKQRAGPQIGGTQCLTKPRSDKEGVPEQRVVPDFGWVKTAELKQREKREYITKSAKLAKRKCINKEWFQSLVGSKILELSPRAKRECINKGGVRLW